MATRRIWAFLLAIAICIGGYLLADWYQVTPEPVSRNFVGRQSCVECHQQQVSLFHGSHHDKAMDLATDETVLADFNDAELEHFGITSRFFRDGEKFMVHTEGPDGEMQDFEVKYVFGVTPLQQYMVELDRGNADATEIGRVQVLRLSWDTNAKSWFYLKPPDVDEKLEPNDPLHWTGITQCWNSSCAECHSTDVHKNFEPLARNYRTTFSEIDVSCEACHGPGSFHIELAQQNSFFWDRQHGYGLVKLKTDSNLPQIETCAPCHSRRTQIQSGYQAGCNFNDYFACQLITDQIYHDDGQIRDEDYVYGSFIQSKMYHNGIRCTDCHDPHSTKVKFNDNRLCTSCHQHPAGKYDSINHHHHSPGTPGSMCVDCHMPATTYMMLDARRDHSLRVPRPDVSVLAGTPNACTGCHLDPSRLPPDSRKPLTQYLDWINAADAGDELIGAELRKTDIAMREAFEKWYPAENSPERTDYYFRMAIGKSRNSSGNSDNADNKTGGEATLLELALDRRVPAFFRASAILDVGDESDSASLETALEALKDPDPNVVSSAMIRIESEIGRMMERARYSTEDRSEELRELAETIAGRLADPEKRIRIEAARIFANLPRESRHEFSTPEQRRAFESGIDEFKKTLLISNERGISHARLGALYEQLGLVDKAQDAYRTAIMVEPEFVGARSNLAALLDQEMRSLQQQIVPKQGEAYSASRIKTISERATKIAEDAFRLRTEEYELLKRDIERSTGLPGTHALHYRFAMASYVQRDMEATEKHLVIAQAQEPDNPTYLLGLATYYRQQNLPEKAIRFVNRLVELDGENPGYRSLADVLIEELANKKKSGTENRE